jgi:ribosomal protein uS17
MAERKKKTEEETPEAIVDETPAAEAAEAPEAPLEAETPVAVEATEAVEEPVAAHEPEDAPVAEPPPDVEAAGAAASAPEPEPEKRKSRKRLPRTLRRQRPKRTRAAGGAARKPFAREPKPESERGARQERRGVVVSNAMDKTIVVRVETLKMHPRYKKVIRRSTKFHAHDEENAAKVGDVVRIVETRPVSKTKRWRLAEVVEAAQ